MTIIRNLMTHIDPQRYYQCRIIRVRSPMYQRWLRVLVHDGAECEPTMYFWRDCYVIRLSKRRWKTAKNKR